MDRPSGRPLTVEEAKQRLRSVSEPLLPFGYARRHPYAILLLAVGTGFIIGKIFTVKGLVTRTLLKAI